MAQRHVTSQALVRLLIGQLAHARGYKSVKRALLPLPPGSVFCLGVVLLAEGRGGGA